VDVLNQEKESSLGNKDRNWDNFRYTVNEKLTSNISLKTEEDIEAAAKFYNDAIHCAGWNATPEHKKDIKGI
jgi:hypothetical protein